MIVYQATKKQFLQDAPDIQDIVRQQVREKLLINIKPQSSEYKAWQNSIGNAMYHVVNSADLHDDATVAIEFGIPFTKKRIDFILAGETSMGEQKVYIVELKQWARVERTDMDGIVRTWLGGGYTETNHPSQKALSYAHLLRNFNESVSQHNIDIRTCAYLHNCESNNELLCDFYRHYWSQSPLFVKQDREKLIKHFESAGIVSDSCNILRVLSESNYKPTEELANKLLDMLQGNQAFMLVDSQKIVFEYASRAIRDADKHARKQVIIIRGGPGTGKSVVAINLLAAGIIDHRKNVRYVTKNSAPRKVFEAKLTNSYKQSEINTLFTGSGSFISSADNEYDALITDEAHRLVEKSGLFSNFGKNQVKEIISAAKVSVFFIDESQQVTWQDMGSVAEIEKWAKWYGADVHSFELESQFRCNGSDGYLAWLDNTLGITPTANIRLEKSEYDFRVFDDPMLLKQHIETLNKPDNRARMLAGYCWRWKSKNNPNEYDIEFPEYGFQMQWNLSKHGGTWIINPESIDQVGCIHTAQGLELQHVGVIIGPDLIVRDGEVVTNPGARDQFDKSLKGYKKAYEEDPEAAQKRADTLIKNTYRTLMSRGMKSCSIFSADAETREYFRERLVG